MKRKTISVRLAINLLVVTALLFMPVLQTSRISAAETGSYPWFDAKEINISTYDWGYAQCQPAMILAVTCNYHYGYKNGITYYQSDPWGYDVRNCTSFVAWKIASVHNKAVSNWGDAKNWDSSAKKYGYEVSQMPAIGSIAVWDSGRYGHVAYVSAVNLDGSVNVEQYNKSGSGEFSRQSRVRADHYIHVVKTFSPLVEVKPLPETISNNNSGSSQTIVQELPVIPVPEISKPQQTIEVSNNNHSEIQAISSNEDIAQYYVGRHTDRSIKAYAIANKNTKSGKVEIFSIDPIHDISAWGLEKVTAEPINSLRKVSYSFADYNADGHQDLYSIVYDKSESGFVEVAVLDGTKGFTSYLGKWITHEHAHNRNDVWYDLADQNGDGVLDLYQVWHNNISMEHVEVAIFDGAKNFSDTLSRTIIPEPQHASTDVTYSLADHNNDGSIDLLQVLHNNTQSKKTEVKVFDGTFQHGRVMSKWVTDLDVYTGDGQLLPAKLASN